MKGKPYWRKEEKKNLKKGITGRKRGQRDIRKTVIEGRIEMENERSESNNKCKQIWKL